MELSIEKRYDRTSIEDIARGAGVSRPIVYEHHGSKEGVYLACVKRTRDHYALELAAALEGVEGPRERLAVAGDTFFSMLERDPDRWTVLFGGSAVPVIGEFGERLTELRFETVANIIENLRASARPGVEDERLVAAAHAISAVGEQLGR